MTEVDDFLAHYGVPGMKWGHHKQSVDGVSGHTSREARKDATEFAKAKMYFGEGAGTRRKLIKATVEAKAKKDPTYQKAFDHHLANQDMAKRASQARGERRRTDTKTSAVKTAKGVHRIMTGGFGNVTLAASVIAGGYGIAHKTGADRVVVNAGKTAMRDVAKSAAVSSVKAALQAKGWIK